MQEKEGKKPHHLSPASNICLAQPRNRNFLGVYYLSQALGLSFVTFSLFGLVYFLGSLKNFELIQNNLYLFFFLFWKHIVILRLIRTEPACYLELISDTAPLFLKLKSLSPLNSFVQKILHTLPFTHQTPILE